MGHGRLIRVWALAWVVVAVTAVPALAQSADEATVTVVHAIDGEDGFPADVYVNEALTVSSMVFEGSSEPVSVPAGEVALELFPAGADPEVDPPILSETITLDGGSDYSVVALLADGAPVMAVYLNDVSPTDAGVGRITIRQSSGEGVLDVAIGETAAVSALESLNQATVEVAAGSTPLVVSSADGSVVFENQLEVQAGSLLVLYAVGSDESFSLLTQQLVTPQVTPTGVPSGTGGLRDVSSAALWVAVPLGFVALTMMAVRPRRQRA